MNGKKLPVGERLKKLWRKNPGRCIFTGVILIYVVFHFAAVGQSPMSGGGTLPEIKMSEDGQNDHSENDKADAMQGDVTSSGGWQVDHVPNPKAYDARNWVCNPDGILSREAEEQINGVLQKLEDSLTIEVAVVALDAIEGNDPRDFAHRLFNRWGVGKAEDDNGLLVLLTLDLRDITFETGYGLEGVLPDLICKRIQTNAMLPWLKDNEWDKGMTEGVKAIAATLYGSDYQAAPPEAWITKFRRTTPALVFIVFGLLFLFMNWLTWKSVVGRLRPKDNNTASALSLLATQRPLTLRTLLGVVWLVPVWPALFAVTIWYWGWQRKETLRRSRTCPKCGKETLKPVPVAAMMDLKETICDHDRKEMELGTTYIRVYTCTACGEIVKLRIPLEKGYECCPACHSITLKSKEKYRTVKKATTSSEGLREARHECLYCGAEYVVGYKIPKISTSSGGSGGHGGSSSSGSFGGGSSGGGGSSSRF